MADEHQRQTAGKHVPSSFLTLRAQAGFITVGFQKITSNNVEDLSGQLVLRIYDAIEANSTFSLALSGNDVLFAYTNIVGIASSVSEVHIDDGTVVSLKSVHNSLGGSTLFVGGSANPGNLPGGNTLSPPFVATSAFAADAQGNPTRGIDTAADILGVSYTTTAGLSGITDAIADGSLRVGLHVRAIGVLGGSDGYVKTGGPAEVPEPCSASAVSVSLDTDDDGQRENPPRFRGTTDVECVLPIGVAHGRDSRQTGEHERKRVRENGNSGKMTMLPAVQYGIFDQKWSTDDMFSSV